MLIHLAVTTPWGEWEIPWVGIGSFLLGVGSALSGLAAIMSSRNAIKKERQTNGEKEDV
jgi:hypothetical protein